MVSKKSGGKVKSKDGDTTNSSRKSPASSVKSTKPSSMSKSTKSGGMFASSGGKKSGSTKDQSSKKEKSVKSSKPKAMSAKSPKADKSSKGTLENSSTNKKSSGGSKPKSKPGSKIASSKQPSSKSKKPVDNETSTKKEPKSKNKDNTGAKKARAKKKECSKKKKSASPTKSTKKSGKKKPAPVKSDANDEPCSTITEECVEPDKPDKPDVPDKPEALEKPEPEEDDEEDSTEDTDAEDGEEDTKDTKDARDVTATGASSSAAAPANQGLEFTKPTINQMVKPKKEVPLSYDEHISRTEYEALYDEVNDLNAGVLTLHQSYGSIIKSLVALNNRRSKKKAHTNPNPTGEVNFLTTKSEISKKQAKELESCLENADKYDIERFINPVTRDETFKQLFDECADLTAKTEKIRTVYFDAKSNFVREQCDRHPEHQVGRKRFNHFRQWCKKLATVVDEICRTYNDNLLNMFRLG